MVTVAEKKCFTPLEYLERERKAEFRSEYDQGVMIPMAGASKEHKRITFNTSGLFWSQLAGSSCEGFAQELRVRVPQCDKYYYPDVVVVCGEPRFEDATFDVLLNPRLVIEVLSDSTERKDREEKFDCYETPESLTDYVLISQTEPRIEHFSRLEGGGWRFVVVRGVESVLSLPAVSCSLRLADIYARVTFPPRPVSEPDEREGE